MQTFRTTAKVTHHVVKQSQCSSHETWFKAAKRLGSDIGLAVKQSQTHVLAQQLAMTSNKK